MREHKYRYYITLHYITNRRLRRERASVKKQLEILTEKTPKRSRSHAIRYPLDPLQRCSAACLVE